MPYYCCISSIKVRKMGHSSDRCNRPSTNSNYQFYNYNWPSKWTYITPCSIFCVHTPRIRDGGGTAWCDIIVHQGEKQWLQKWKDLMTTEYSYFECDIEPNELTISKIAYGVNVIIDGCNSAQKTNRWVYIIVYKVYIICCCTNDIYFLSFTPLNNIIK